MLILDGLEPLQHPPGSQEGRLREPALQALLRELAAINSGLCVITTRMPITDLADHEHTSALRRDLEQLSSEAGAKLLRALGVRGDDAELRDASDEFRGHCLALTLLGSYLTDAYDGDIRRREEISTHLPHDVRQGAHAKKVMDSYQSWLGEGPELSVLRMLGLFDRPADERALGALLKPPAIQGLTESLVHLRPAEWHTVLSRLRSARLLAGEDRHNPGQMDAHPLVREYFGEQLRIQKTEAWKECNRRLFDYYRALAPQLPENAREMEPLFLAVICGCKAGLFREALHEVYIPRIQRGKASFAANVLGARGALLSVLAHFFEEGRWGTPMETQVEGQGLNAEDRLYILMQAGQNLTATRGSAAPEARTCYENAESFCYSLNRRTLLYAALIGKWRYSLNTDKMTATMRIARKIYGLAQEEHDPGPMIGACRPLACTLYFLGDFPAARWYATRGADIWRSEGARFEVEEPIPPAVSCLCFKAVSEWHLNELASCDTSITEAVSLAKELNDAHALATALWYAAAVAHFARDPARVQRVVSDLIELSTRHGFTYWRAGGMILHGWARAISEDVGEGLALIGAGIQERRATGSMLAMPFFLALKAEALHLADRSAQALEAIGEAEAFVERFEERSWCAEILRLRGIVLARLRANNSEIEAAFLQAIRTAKEQESVSLVRRAEASYAEHRSPKGAA